MLKLPVLGIDPGSKRIGVAGVNELGFVANLGVCAAQPREKLFEKIIQLARDRGCSGFVVGLPLHMDGSESAGSQFARRLGAELEAASGLPVEFCDERMTSYAAEERLKEAGWDIWQIKSRVDGAAAVGILENYLALMKLATGASDMGKATP